MIRILKWFLIIFIFILAIIVTQIVLMPIILGLIDVNKINQDIWISFYGSLLGGAIGGIATIVAIVVTIKYYEKQNRKNTNLTIKMPVINKVDEILSQIAERNTISSNLFSYISELKPLKNKIERYNELQGYLLAYFTNEGIRTMARLFNINIDGDGVEDTEYTRYYQLPEHIIAKGKTIGKKSLYENYFEMFRGDEELGRFIDFEAGGSYGLWAANWCVRQYHEEPHFFDMRDEFLELIPELINELELIRNELIK